MRRVRAVTRLCWVVGILSSCGPELDTRYGEVGSIHGFSGLEATFTDRFDARRRTRLGPRVEDKSLIVAPLIHSRTAPSDAEEWIDTWLRDRGGRTFVLLLRDGGVTAPLSRVLAERVVQPDGGGDPEWSEDDRRAIADEFLEMASDAPDPMPPPLSLEDVLEDPEDDEAPFESDDWRYVERTWTPWFEERSIGPQRDADRLEGEAPYAPADAPLLLQMRRAWDTELEHEVAVAADGAPLLIKVPFPDDSELWVWMNATPFFDASLVDPASRKLLQALCEDLERRGHSDDGGAAWVDEATLLATVSANNQLVFLFSTWPWNILFLHLAVLGVLFTWSRARHLGRIEAIRTARRTRFRTHIEALAAHVADDRAWSWCVSRIAAVRGLPAPPKVDTAAEGCQQLRSHGTSSPTQKDRS